MSQDGSLRSLQNGSLCSFDAGISRDERERERTTRHGRASVSRELPDNHARCSDMRMTNVRTIADTHRKRFMHDLGNFRGVILGVLGIDPPASGVLIWPGVKGLSKLFCVFSSGASLAGGAPRKRTIFVGRLLPTSDAMDNFRRDGVPLSRVENSQL